jgi:hypothetical protein
MASGNPTHLPRSHAEQIMHRFCCGSVTAGGGRESRCATQQTAYKAGAVPPERGFREFILRWPKQSTS